MPGAGSEAEAAVAILHVPATDSVLLIRRAERADDSWSGHWSLPGGRRQPEDRDSLDTALRELAEECGIRLRREQMRQALAERVARRRAGPWLLVAPFVFELDSEPAAILDPDEAAASVWMPLNFLRDPARHALRRVPGVPGQMLFPAIELGDVPLWGFTYRLLCDWLGVAPPDPGPGER